MSNVAPYGIVLVNVFVVIVGPFAVVPELIFAVDVLFAVFKEAIIILFLYVAALVVEQVSTLVVRPVPATVFVYAALVDMDASIMIYGIFALVAIHPIFVVVVVNAIVFRDNALVPIGIIAIRLEIFFRGIEFVIVMRRRVVAGRVVVVVVIDERILITENVVVFEISLNIERKVVH